MTPENVAMAMDDIADEIGAEFVVLGIECPGCGSMHGAVVPLDPEARVVEDRR